jgi:hypothetical protein
MTAQAELDLLQAEQRCIADELDKAREPVVRLEAIIAGAAAAQQRLAEFEQAHDEAVGEAMASGEAIPPPPPALVEARPAAKLAVDHAQTAERALRYHQSPIAALEARLAALGQRIHECELLAEADRLVSGLPRFREAVAAALRIYGQLEGRRRWLLAQGAAGMAALGQFDRHLSLLTAPDPSVAATWEGISILAGRLESIARNDGRAMAIAMAAPAELHERPH